jgi:hypothetical protein
MKDTLHLYAQDFQHGQAEIAGDAESLKRLVEAILRAIEYGKSNELFFVTDGEGYSVDIYCFTPEQMGRLRVPYTDKDAAEFQSSGQLWPYEVPPAPAGEGGE